jgi:hypothetical protein
MLQRPEGEMMHIPVYFSNYVIHNLITRSMRRQPQNKKPETDFCEAYNRILTVRVNGEQKSVRGDSVRFSNIITAFET